YPDGHFDYVAPASRDNDLSTPEDTDGPDDDSFQYTTVDRLGQVSNEVTSTITILDTVPAAVDDGTYPVAETTELHGNVLSNDVSSADLPVVVNAVRASADGSDLSVTEPADPYSTTTWTHITTDHGGTVSIRPDGNFWYAPDPNYIGEDSFQYQLVDADGSTGGSWATVTVDVPAPGASPVTGTVSVEHLVAEGDSSGILGQEDVFVWKLADVQDQPLNSTITDFNAEDGDKLDLHDLLTDSDNNPLFDTDHLSVTSDGNSTTVTVNPVAPEAQELTIVIDGVDLTGGNTGQDAINHMLDNHTLDNG
ncbi:MAG: type I secretion C-terminal target domain-containing protein, partial [Azoarcus sp.]|nr:type I secretion C-terminal target domain-containing protein [Azoarcus sp.]